ncbi:hypothetical protein [Muricoccus radiodurans]|uniref:hypothetical protein n=1 Tax=Muricoccus radiodurans TaxID=2231721 RepID=UPI003CF8ACDC
MDVTLEFSIAFVDGASPHHARPPVLRRITPSAEVVSLSRDRATLRARVSLPTMTAATYTLSLSGRDFFDAEFSFSLVGLGPVVTPIVASPFVRRVVVRPDPRGPVVAIDVMAPRLREVPGPGPDTVRQQRVARIADEPLAAFPRQAPVGRGNGVLVHEPDGNTFLADIRSVDVEPARLHYFELKQGHALIAAYVPSRALPTAGDYVMYFKPPKHNATTPKEVVEIYMTQGGASVHSQMAAYEESETTAIHLLLVGEAGSVPQWLVTANGLHAAILELDASLRAGNPFLVGSGVRSIALAGFSQGGEYLASVMHRVTHSPLDGLLKAVFVFDCFFPNGEPPFKNSLRTWFNGGSDRVIRSYWGHTVHRCDLYDSEPGSAFAGDDGTVQRTMRFGHPAGVPDYMWIGFTEAFLKHRCQFLKQGTDLHHAIPKIFLPHALRTAGMARLGI